MTSASRRHVRTLLLALLLLVAPAIRAVANNCADGGRPRPDQGGIGGTGALPRGPDDEGGIGGTGALPRAPDDEGGVGGTGLSIHGDTGIIGTITGFASICVGGLEVHYAADTAVEIDGQRATTARLAAGQVVEVIAKGIGSEVSAQYITVHHIVSGPVTRVDAERSEIDVVGQTVRLSPATRAGGSDGEYSAVATSFPLNSFVQVSGLRMGDGVVVASRVTGGAAGDVVQLSGPVTKLDSGALAIAGTQLRIDDRTQPSVGDEVHVIGRWDGSAVVARSVESIPRIPFDGRVPRLDIEGYAQQFVAGQLHVGPFLVELPHVPSPEAQLPAPDARIRIQAVVHDRHVIVERIGVISDLPTGPPLPDRESRGGKGGGPSDGGHANGAPAFDQPRQDERGGAAPPARDHMMPPGAPDVGEVGAPPHPDGPDRPVPPQLPDRVDRPAAPQLPDRPDRPAPPELPDRPNRPEPPARPDRPLAPERPLRPERPDMRGRP